jgi:hypothetical protein
MTFSRISLVILSSSLVLALSACGGGGGGDSQGETGAAFSAKFNAGQTSLNSSSGIATTTATDAFDEKYLDQGVKKADIAAAVSTTSQAAAVSPDLSFFPMAQVSNVVVSGCDSGICTLTGTLTNADADTTTVDFTTKVKFYSGLVLLYGDQAATPSI